MFLKLTSSNIYGHVMYRTNILLTEETLCYLWCGSEWVVSDPMELLYSIVLSQTALPIGSYSLWTNFQRFILKVKHAQSFSTPSELSPMAISKNSAIVKNEEFLVTLFITVCFLKTKISLNRFAAASAKWLHYLSDYTQNHTHTRIKTAYVRRGLIFLHCSETLLWNCILI